ncbi:MFS transporter [Streptomyces viridochromogenes]|uniref:Putative transporter YdjK n=1 Tax=Streptomyces viridochromogenes Tue57 TaxID=1160705 RepID=L8P0I8_STRVR|nr:MFS transporter [Streptomyces viridochromogenes]ELS51081.1 putative transporter YdjK [Streptomyces viridochromogenes Tue57]
MNHIARLERLPMSRTHRRLLIIGGLGYTFDGADAAIIAFILPVVAQQWDLSAGQISLLASALLIGFLFGALTAGTLGDKLGRKKVMLGSLIVYTSMTLVAAFAPNFWVLFAFRVLAGAGIGAESAIIAPYLSEFVPGRYRGRFIGAVAGFFSFGYVLSALIGRYVISPFEDGWRYAQIILALPILAVIWWRRSMPESPRYLLSKGRVEEAERVVGALEESVRKDTGAALPPVPAETAAVSATSHLAHASMGKKLAVLWSGPFARRTLVAWVMWFCLTFAYYGFFTMMPKLLADSGMTVVKSFSFVLYIYLAQIPGYFSAAFLSEYLDRKRAIALYLSGATLSALGMALSHSEAAIIGFGAALSLFMNGVYALLYTYTPETYPTEIRATGQGTASAFGRVGGIIAPFAFTAAAAQGGLNAVFGVTSLVLLTGVLTVLSLGLATKGRTLEDLNPKDRHRAVDSDPDAARVESPASP